MFRMFLLSVLSLLPLGCVAFTTIPESAPVTKPDLDVERIEEVADAFAQAELAEGLVPGMTVAVAKNGELVFVRAYGKADLELDVPAAAETVYRIRSVTKQFTAAAILRLVEEGTLSSRSSTRFDWSINTCPRSFLFPLYPSRDSMSICCERLRVNESDEDQDVITTERSNEKHSAITHHCLAEGESVTRPSKSMKFA